MVVSVNHSLAIGGNMRITLLQLCDTLPSHYLTIRYLTMYVYSYKGLKNGLVLRVVPGWGWGRGQERTGTVVGSSVAASVLGYDRLILQQSCFSMSYTIRTYSMALRAPLAPLTCTESVPCNVRHYTRMSELPPQSYEWHSSTQPW